MMITVERLFADAVAPLVREAAILWRAGPGDDDDDDEVPIGDPPDDDEGDDWDDDEDDDDDEEPLQTAILQRSIALRVASGHNGARTTGGTRRGARGVTPDP